MKKKNEYLLPLAIVMSLFFLCGLSTVLNSILIPYLQQVQKISYTSANLIQVSFYSAYLLFSPLTAYLLKSIHYVTGMKRGILFATLGSALLTFATAITSFPLILIGIFFVGGGIAMLQVTGNPYVMKLGSIETASRRMVALHAVTATGMIIAPLLGSHFILEKIEESYQHLIGPLALPIWH